MILSIVDFNADVLNFVTSDHTSIDALQKAFLDCRNMTGEIKIFESFNVAEYGVKMIGIISKTALVGREDQMLPDNFVENVAVNRGVNLKIFTEIEKAIDWLKE